jgi:integrase
MKTAQLIRNKNQVRELAAYFFKRGEIRNHVLIVMGVHTALRISDLRRLMWEDVYDFEHKRFRDSIVIKEAKQTSPKAFCLTRK